MTKYSFLWLFTLLFSTTGIAEVCTNATALPFNTRFASGPTLAAIVTANPDIGTAIYNARDQWDITDAADHIGDWNGIISNSDCPVGQATQLGAYDFSDPTACSITIPPGSIGSRAYNITGGSRSIAFNLNVVWSLNPLAGQYDLESVVVHELGHMLGMAHQSEGVCTNALSPSCVGSQDIETMGATTHPGETCQRDLEANDIQSADFLY